jgi:hypothetical protein
MVKIIHLFTALIWLIHPCIFATDCGSLQLDGATQIRRAHDEGGHPTLYTAVPFETLLREVWKESLADSSDTAHILLSASLGAEPGDPLLNAYTGQATFNRDHFSQSHVFLHHGPLVLYGGYRYLDTYSDRFDSIWSAHALQGFAMQQSALGLAEELIGGAIISAKSSSAELGASRYSYWGHTPLWFTPLLHCGIRTYAEGRLSVGEWQMQTRLALQKQQRYLDRINPQQRTVVQLQANLSRQLWGSTLPLTLTYANDSLIPLSVAAEAPFELGVFKLAPHLGLDRYGMTGGIVAGAQMSTILSGRMNVDWYRVPMSKGYEYSELGQIVVVEDAIVSGLLMSLQVMSVAKDSLLWAQIRFERDGAAQIDKVEYGDTLHLTPCRVDARLVGTCGAGARYRAKSWQVMLAVAGERVLDGGPMRLSLPFEGALSLRWHHPQATTLWGAISLCGRSSVEYFRQEQSRSTTYSSAPRMWVDMSIGVPLLMPLWTEVIKPRVKVEVNSLTIAGKRRQPMHPLGNAIGPRLALQAELRI